MIYKLLMPNSLFNFPNLKKMGTYRNNLPTIFPLITPVSFSQPKWFFNILQILKAFKAGFITLLDEIINGANQGLKVVVHIIAVLFYKDCSDN